MGNVIPILIQTYMKTTVNKIIIALVAVSLFGCYEDYVKDFDYAAVYFGTSKPLRTLVTKTGEEELVFRVGVGLGGVRENTTGYDVEYAYDPGLIATPPLTANEVSRVKLLPENCYTIENGGKFTFHIPKGKLIGDCEVRINKNAFVAMEGALKVGDSRNTTWVIPLRLLSTTADMILEGKDWTLIGVKYIDEHSGNYYCRGSQTAADGSVKEHGAKNDWTLCPVRLLATVSPTEFDMAGMGDINSAPVAADHLLIRLINGAVTLERRSASTHDIKDLGSSYNPTDKTFNLKYEYTKGADTFQVDETLKLRKNVEEELRWEEWSF
jgi:hypothetical protein